MNDQHSQLAGFIVERLEQGVFAVDPDFNIVLWNRFMHTHSGKSWESLKGTNLFQSFPELPEAWLKRKIESVFALGNYAFTSWEQRAYLFRFKHNRPITGGVDAMLQNCTFLPLRNSSGKVELVVVTLQDCTDNALIQQRLAEAITVSDEERRKQQELIVKLEDAKNQLFQSEKLASIGQLAAGVAHEINNPIGFVNSNLGTLERNVTDLMKLVAAFESKEIELPEVAQKELKKIKKEIDFEYLKEDLADLIKESKEGLGHVRRIVADLKDFSRVDQSGWQIADLEKCIDTTLNVVSNEIRYKTTVVKEYGHPPLVECVPGQINQVLMNLVVNAAQAFPERGQITLRTGEEGMYVWIEVEDDGVGIPPENLQRIFEPFFTTKPVGTGTGLGLSVCYNIIRKHEGDLTVRSEVGKGTCFRVKLPIFHGKMGDTEETEAANSVPQ
jgi:two-component system, NtrC family, sensor kinase